MRIVLFLATALVGVFCGWNSSLPMMAFISTLAVSMSLRGMWDMGLFDRYLKKLLKMRRSEVSGKMANLPVASGACLLAPMWLIWVFH